MSTGKKKKKQESKDKEYSFVVKLPWKKTGTRYILDQQARNAVIIVAVIFVAAILVAVSVIVAGHNDKTNEAVNEKAISLIGVTDAGYSLLENTGKFDGFWVDASGEHPGKLYDTDMTADESLVLESRNQLPDEGMFAYNEEMSTKAKLEAENGNANKNINTDTSSSDTSTGVPRTTNNTK